MIIYLVCNTVDLGYHAEYAYTTLEKAKMKMAELVTLSKAEYVKRAMRSSATNTDTELYDQAVKDDEYYAEQWEIDSVEIEE